VITSDPYVETYYVRVGRAEYCLDVACRARWEE
jgi:hypothetical protein